MREQLLYKTIGVLALTLIISLGYKYVNSDHLSNNTDRHLSQQAASKATVMSAEIKTQPLINMSDAPVISEQEQLDNWQEQNNPTLVASATENLHSTSEERLLQKNIDQDKPAVVYTSTKNSSKKDATIAVYRAEQSKNASISYISNPSDSLATALPNDEKVALQGVINDEMSQIVYEDSEHDHEHTIDYRDDGLNNYKSLRRVAEDTPLNSKEKELPITLAIDTNSLVYESKTRAEDDYEYDNDDSYNEMSASDDYVYDYERCSSFKIRGGMFIPQSKLYRCIYGKVGWVVELELATKIANHLELWANLDGLYKRGHSIGFCSRTKIGVGSLSAGFKLYHQGDCVMEYLGIGPNFSELWIRNYAIGCPCEKVRKGAFGFVVKTGLNWFVGRRTFLEFFADYLYQPVRFKTQCKRVNIGGVKIGLGIGFTF